MSEGATQTAAVLHGPRDVRVEDVPVPPQPGPGEVSIRVDTVGVCGSDLHMYEDGRIGETPMKGPTVLGHEFGGTVERTGADALDGEGHPLEPGTRVAVDPAIPCLRCELCLAGHPNLCPNHTFMGVFPTGGALQQRLTVPSFCCFPLPEAVPDDHVPLLETLGVALHAVDLAHVHVASSVAVIGAGSVGQLIARVAMLAGALPLFVTDRHPPRLDAAAAVGATPLHIDEADPVQAVMDATAGRGVDVAIEAAWSDASSLGQAANMLRPGGRLVVVGISGDDTLHFPHSPVRRKGLTIAMCRRMKHTYRRAIALAASGRIDLAPLVTHRYPLHQTADAFAAASSYGDGVIKAVVRCN